MLSNKDWGEEKSAQKIRKWAQSKSSSKQQQMAGAPSATAIANFLIYKSATTYFYSSCMKMDRTKSMISFH